MVLHHAVAQEAVDELQKLRPFAEPLRQAPRAPAFAPPPDPSASPRTEATAPRPPPWRPLPGARLSRQNIIAARGDEPRGVAPALQEGAQILLAPGVVDDEKDAPVAQRLAELGGGGVQVFEAGPLAAQDLDEVRDDGEQVFGLLAKLGPEDAVEIGVLDVRVVGQRFRKRGLAIAARAAQRRRDGDRVALGVEQLLSSARRTRPGAARNPPEAPAPSSARGFCVLGPSSTRISSSVLLGNVRDRKPAQASAAAR